VLQLLIAFKRTYIQLGGEVLYNMPIDFGIPMKLARLIKMCLNEPYSRVRVDKHLCDIVPVMNGLKQGDALSPMLFNFVLEYAIRTVQVNQNGFILNGTHNLLVYLIMYIYRVEAYMLLRKTQ
jgi:hypothetical protein